jgi:hypothetical protein
MDSTQRMTSQGIRDLNDQGPKKKRVSEDAALPAVQDAPVLPAPEPAPGLATAAV